MTRQRITTMDSEMADDIGVLRFAAAMKRKLTKKRAEGRHGWNYPVPANRNKFYHAASLRGLETQLRQHIAKGDMVDLANFAMMIWNRRNPRGIE